MSLVGVEFIHKSNHIRVCLEVDRFAEKVELSSLVWYATIFGWQHSHLSNWKKALIRIRINLIAGMFTHTRNFFFGWAWVFCRTKYVIKVWNDVRLSKLFLILGLIILFIHHIYGKTFCQFYFRIVVALFSLKFCRSFNPTNLLIHILPHAISSQTPPPQKILILLLNL